MNTITFTPNPPPPSPRLTKFCQKFPYFRYLTPPPSPASPHEHPTELCDIFISTSSPRCILGIHQWLPQSSGNPGCYLRWRYQHWGYGPQQQPSANSGWGSAQLEANGLPGPQVKFPFGKMTVWEMKMDIFRFSRKSILSPIQFIPNKFMMVTNWDRAIWKDFTCALLQLWSWFSKITYCSFAKEILQLKILVLQRNEVHSHSCFSVYFSGNPWDCDCHLEWMLEVNMQATTRNMIRYGLEKTFNDNHW